MSSEHILAVNDVLVGTSYTGRYILHRSVHLTPVGTSYTGRYILHRSVHLTPVGTSYTGRYIFHRSVHLTPVCTSSTTQCIFQLYALLFLIDLTSWQVDQPNKKIKTKSKPYLPGSGVLVIGALRKDGEAVPRGKSVVPVCEGDDEGVFLDAGLAAATMGEADWQVNGALRVDGEAVPRGKSVVPVCEGDDEGVFLETGLATMRESNLSCWGVFLLGGEVSSNTMRVAVPPE